MPRSTPLIALAAAVLAAPLAFAQSPVGEANRSDTSTTRATPPQVRAGDTTTTRDADLPDARIGEAASPFTTGTNNPATTLDRTEQNAMTRNPAIPEQTTGAQHAAPPSAIAQRGTWTQFDTDGDGRISVSEAEASVDFSNSFGAMDTDGDGYISDTEYRAHARTTHPLNRGDAVVQDPTLGAGGAAGRGQDMRDDRADDVRTDDDRDDDVPPGGDRPR